MDLLRRLANSAQNVSKAFAPVTAVPLGIAQAANRATPWGQAHQAQMNSATNHLYTQGVKRQGEYIPTGNQLSGGNPMELQVQAMPSTYGWTQNPQISAGSMGYHAQRPGYYDQQSAQLGTPSIYVGPSYLRHPIDDNLHLLDYLSRLGQ